MAAELAASPRLFGGFLNLAKPAGPRCSTMLNAVASHIASVAGPGKRGRVKAGWVGTLDPMASGVVPVALGGATRCIELMPAGWKRYRARVLLGAGSASDDADADESWAACDFTGAARDLHLRLAQAAAEPRGTAHVQLLPSSPTAEQLLASVASAARALSGPTAQTPSLVSALRVDGERAHELARRGELTADKLQARPQLVRSVRACRAWERPSGATMQAAEAALVGLSKLGWEAGAPLPAGLGLDERSLWARHRALAQLAATGALQGCSEVEIDVVCDGGTFIRALARDIGALLGTSALLTSLERTESSGMALSTAMAPAQAAEAGYQTIVAGTAMHAAGAPSVLLSSSEGELAVAQGALASASAADEDAAPRVATQAAWALLQRRKDVARAGPTGQTELSIPVLVERPDWPGAANSDMGQLSLPLQVAAGAVPSAAAAEAIVQDAVSDAELRRIGEALLANVGAVARVKLQRRDASDWTTARRSRGGYRSRR